MDGPILTRAATAPAPVTPSFALAPLPTRYAKDDNSAERGSQVALQNMQRHELRQRQRQRQEPVDSDDSSATMGQDLTPNSRDEQEEIEGIIPLFVFSTDQV